MAYIREFDLREDLATVLFNTLNHAKAEDDLPRRDALLNELRDLARRYREDVAVREQLAKGLFNTLNHAKAEDALSRRDALLNELRALAMALSRRCRGARAAGQRPVQHAEPRQGGGRSAAA